MTFREEIENELIQKLTTVYKEWLTYYNLTDDDIYFSDGEYDPPLIDVLNNIVVIMYDEEDE